MTTHMFFWIFTSFCMADGFNDGKAYTQQNHQDAPSLDQTGLNPTNNPIEAGLTHDTIAARLESEKKRDDIFLSIKHAQKEREQVEIDVTLPEVDVQDDKSGNISISADDAQEGAEYINKTCLINGEHYTQICRRQRIIELEVIPQQTKIYRYCAEGGSHGRVQCRINGEMNIQSWSCSDCATRTIITRPKKVTIIKEEWVGCEDLEAMRDRGDAEVLCETPGPLNERRIIQGEEITRDYFETTREYALNTKVIDTCAPLKILGCQQIDARCGEEKQLEDGPKICLMYEKTYQCPLAKSDQKQTHMKFGLDIPKGPPVIANQNMMQALSQLEALKQMAKLKTVDGNNITFLKGEAMTCTTNFGGSFKDCCHEKGGFGTKIKMATQCTTQELNLQRAKKEGRCVFIGSRAKNNTLGINFSKEYGYCCFPSRLSLSIQRGARQQLGLTFGDVNNPQCDGLRAEDLERVDFSTIDLSDTFQDIMKSTEKMKSAVQDDLSYAQKRFKNQKRDVADLNNHYNASSYKTDQQKGDENVF